MFACGEQGSAAVLEDGSIYAWGMQRFFVPTIVPGSKEIGHEIASMQVRRGAHGPCGSSTHARIAHAMRHAHPRPAPHTLALNATSVSHCVSCTARGDPPCSFDAQREGVLFRLGHGASVAQGAPQAVGAHRGERISRVVCVVPTAVPLSWPSWVPAPSHLVPIIRFDAGDGALVARQASAVDGVRTTFDWLHRCRCRVMMGLQGATDGR